MPGSFGEGQDRGHACVGAFENLSPVVSGLLQECRGDRLCKGIPAGTIVLVREGLGREFQTLQQQRIEPWFDRANRNVLAVTALICG